MSSGSSTVLMALTKYYGAAYILLREAQSVGAENSEVP